MYQYFKNLWSDETRFIGVARALMMIAGLAFESGQLDFILSPEGGETGPIAKAFGVLLIGTSMFMRSSSSASVPVAEKK